MAPAPTQHSKEKMQSENQISIRKDKRIPFTEGEVPRCDYSTIHEHQYQPASVTHGPVVNTRRRAVLKRGQNCDKYAFGTRKRVTRNVDLTFGVSAKSFPLLNKCRDFSIYTHKMSDQDIAQAIYSLQNSPQV